MNGEGIVIKKRGEDGSRLITIRIKNDILNRLDQISGEVNYSRNELVNMLLRYEIENLKVE